MPDIDMKVTLCTQRFVPPFVGGVDVYADRLQGALRQLGVEVGVIAVDTTEDGTGGDIRVTPEELGKVMIHRVRVPFASRPKEAFDLAYDSQMGTTFEAILEAERPDLFIIMNFYVTSLAVIESAKKLSIPVIHIATDFIPVCRRGTFIRWDGSPCETGESVKSCSACFVAHRSLGRMASRVLERIPEETLVRWAHNRENHQLIHPLRIIEPYLNQVAVMERRLELLAPLKEMIDLVLVPTKYTARMFLENGFAAHQIEYLPFGMQERSLKESVRNIPQDRIRFLFIGRLQPYKGAHILIEAFNQLKSPNGATLTIYGIPDGHEDYYQDLQKKMSTNPRIVFGGRIAPEEIPSAFAGSDFFVLPSLWHENSPLILLDALQTQTPVIASNIAGVTEVVQDGVNGFIFPMGDQRALQEVLQRVISDPDWRHRLRREIPLPDINDYARKLTDIYIERWGKVDAIGAQAVV